MATKVDVPSFKLNNSTTIPAIAIGVGNPTDDAESAVFKALEIGFRHIDTAEQYTTEATVGRALQKAFASGLVKREDVYVTTKIPPESLHIGEIISALKKSLSNLQLDYVDLYLIHWPMRLKKGTTLLNSKLEDRLPLDLKGTWEEMETAVSLGLAKSIGVSNFSRKRLQELLPHAKIVPAINQIELHVYWQQTQLRTFCKEKGIQLSAWSPLRAPGAAYGAALNVLENPVLTEIAEKHRKSASQVALRWVYEAGAIPLPKSYNEKRLLQNISIWDFELTSDDHEKIKTIEQSSLCTDPEFLAVVGGVHWFTFEEFLVC